MSILRDIVSFIRSFIWTIPPEPPDNRVRVCVRGVYGDPSVPRPVRDPSLDARAFYDQGFGFAIFTILLLAAHACFIGGLFALILAGVALVLGWPAWSLAWMALPCYAILMAAQWCIMLRRDALRSC